MDGHGAEDPQHPVTARLVGPASSPGGEVVVGHLTYDQATPSAVWVVSHGLGFHPNVTVQDSAGSIVEGEVTYDSTNQLTLTFAGAFSGRAFLS